VNGIEDAVVDSSAMAWIRMAKDAEPTEDALNEALKGVGSKVQKLTKVTRPQEVVTFEITMKGFS
jgi:hypothetical protein